MSVGVPAEVTAHPDGLPIPAPHRSSLPRRIWTIYRYPLLVFALSRIVTAGVMAMEGWVTRSHQRVVLLLRQPVRRGRHVGLDLVPADRAAGIRPGAVPRQHAGLPAALARMPVDRARGDLVHRHHLDRRGALDRCSSPSGCACCTGSPTTCSDARSHGARCSTSRSRRSRSSSRPSTPRACSSCSRSARSC